MYGSVIVQAQHFPCSATLHKCQTKQMPRSSRS